MRLSAAAVLLLAASLGVVGCDAMEDAGDSSFADDAPGIVEQTDASAVIVPAEQVESCVAQIKFGAEIGDALWGEVWNAVGQTEAGASMYCSEIGSAEPMRLLAIHEAWLPVEASIAAAMMTEQAPPVDAAAPAPACNSNYEGCVPIASDVDCVDGEGDGPAYVAGPLRVLGSDPYGLDNDGDGWAC